MRAAGRVFWDADGCEWRAQGSVGVTTGEIAGEIWGDLEGDRDDCLAAHSVPMLYCKIDPCLTFSLQD